MGRGIYSFSSEHLQDSKIAPAPLCRILTRVTISQCSPIIVALVSALLPWRVLCLGLLNVNPVFPLAHAAPPARSCPRKSCIRSLLWKKKNKFFMPIIPPRARVRRFDFAIDGIKLEIYLFSSVADDTPRCTCFLNERGSMFASRFLGPASAGTQHRPSYREPDRGYQGRPPKPASAFGNRRE